MTADVRDKLIIESLNNIAKALESLTRVFGELEKHLTKATESLEAINANIESLETKTPTPVKEW